MTPLPVVSEKTVNNVCQSVKGVNLLYNVLLHVDFHRSFPNGEILVIRADPLVTMVTIMPPFSFEMNQYGNVPNHKI